jgi:hypothetical protein
MTKLFKRTNPGEALQATQLTLSDTETKIRDLQQQRAAKLLGSDGLDEVVALDREIAACEQAAGVHRDRAAALVGEVARARREQAQIDHDARVAATAVKLDARDAIAVKLDTAIADMAAAYFELIDANVEISRQWGYSNNALRAGALGESIIASMVSHALHAAGRPRAGVSRLPGPHNTGLGVIGTELSGSFAERIAAASAALLEMVRGTPARQDEDAAA